MNIQNDLSTKNTTISEKVILRGVEDGKSRIEDGGWRMEDRGWRMEDGL